jgi:ketosteroid isomerase-like protein
MNNKYLAILALLAVLTPGAARADFSINPDAAALTRLNDDNVQAFLHSDVARYRELLADDFTAVLADGRLIDKAEFLRLQRPGLPAPVTDFKVDEVVIRQYGDTALVNGRISYRRPDGIAAQRRYLDVYVRRDGRWQAVSRQLTPSAGP